MEDATRNPLLSIRISTELYERLIKVAESYGVTKGEIARLAIAQYLEQVNNSQELLRKK